MSKTNVDKHLEKLSRNLDFRAEYALLEISDRLSKAVRSRRESLKLTQEDLANRLGTKQSQISRLEDPLYSRHSLLSLAKVADILGCSLHVELKPSVRAANTPVTIHTFTKKRLRA